MITALKVGTEIHAKVWGNEYWIVNNPFYCAKLLELWHGYRCSLHSHQMKTETFTVLDGSIYLEVNGIEFLLPPGGRVTLHPGNLHRFRAATPTAHILEVSTHHDEADSFRVEPSGEFHE